AHIRAIEYAIAPLLGASIFGTTKLDMPREGGSEMSNYLDYKNKLLCVLVEYEVLQGNSLTRVKEWYPVREADVSEVTTLLGRPLTEVEANEGVYVDEEGNVFELADKGDTRAIEVEREEIEREQAVDEIIEEGVASEKGGHKRTVDRQRRGRGRSGARVRAR